MLLFTGINKSLLSKYKMIVIIDKYWDKAAKFFNLTAKPKRNSIIKVLNFVNKCYLYYSADGTYPQLKTPKIEVTLYNYKNLVKGMYIHSTKGRVPKSVADYKIIDVYPLLGISNSTMAYTALELRKKITYKIDNRKKYIKLDLYTFYNIFGADYNFLNKTLKTNIKKLTTPVYIRRGRAFSKINGYEYTDFWRL